jgi:peptidyl-prolyl cis-trans isomerase D
MLQAINDRIKGWLGGVVVAIIALPFMFWGIQSYTGTSVQQYAAKIDDIEISPRELEFYVSQQRRMLLQRYNGQLPFAESMLKEQVLNRLIDQKLIEMISYRNGYRISDAELSGNIKKAYSRDGAFDRIMYDSVRQSQGKSDAQFEHSLRNQLRVNQMHDGIAKSGLILNTEARRITEIESQSREASLLIFNLDNFTKDVSVAEEEIKDAYNAGSDRYMSPEKISVEYVELKSDALSSAAAIDEQQVKSMYNDYVVNISKREKRKASHILLKIGSDDKSDKAATKKKLEDFRMQLETGSSFKELAREHSEDPVSAKQGGDLGWIEPDGQMVKPFEDALFVLEEGEISGVVESQFGMHLIKLTKIKRASLKPLDEMRGEFEQTLKKDAASNMFYELSENMATAAFENPGSLDAVVDAMSLKLQESDLFTKDSGTGIASNELVRKAAFSSTVVEQGNNSDVIELAPDHVVVLRIKQHDKPGLLPFDEVKSDIENVLRLRKGHDLTLAAGITAKEKIEAGEAIKSVLYSGQKIDKPGPLTRKDAGKVDRRVLAAMFEMARPEDGKVAAKEIILDSGDVALVVLEKVNKVETLDQNRVVAIKRQLNQGIAVVEFSSMLESLKDLTDINKNPKVLQQADN